MAEQKIAALRRWMASRRQIVLGAAAVTGAGALGLVWVGATSPRDLVISLIQRALPGVPLDRESVSACADRVLADVGAPYESSLIQRTMSAVKLKGVRALSQLVGLERVAAMGPFEQRLDEITRVALTEFLPNSNFFHVADPRAETIYYTAPDPNAACGNPFADLSPPA